MDMEVVVPQFGPYTDWFHSFLDLVLGRSFSVLASQKTDTVQDVSPAKMDEVKEMKQQKQSLLLQHHNFVF